MSRLNWDISSIISRILRYLQTATRRKYPRAPSSNFVVGRRGVDWSEGRTDPTQLGQNDGHVAPIRDAMADEAAAACGPASSNFFQDFFRVAKSLRRMVWALPRIVGLFSFIAITTAIFFHELNMVLRSSVNMILKIPQNYTWIIAFHSIWFQGWNFKISPGL